MSIDVVTEALCAVHAQPARGTCKRCGGFVCETCPPGSWCDSCRVRIQELHGDGGGAVVVPGLSMATLGGLSLFLSVYFIANVSEAYGRTDPETAQVFAEQPVVPLLLSTLPLVLSLVMTVAGIQMARNRSYGLAVAGALASLLHLASLCWFVSVGVGIWSLLVLRRPDVRAVFEAERERLDA